MDPCLAAVLDHHELDPKLILDFFVKFGGLAKRTPPERIAQAVAEELHDLCAQTARALRSAVQPEPPVEQALHHLDAAQADFDPAQPETAHFPSDALRSLQGALPEAARDILDSALSHHAGLQARLTWLLQGTSREQLERLDPRADADRIYHALMSTFRVESRVLELLTINRISQSAALALFIRSTGESEERPVARFYDTYSLFANYFEWGAESRRGRATIARMNGIHGRYHLPNDGMKYILLQTAFTWLDGLDRIGHRALSRTEREGYFHAHVRMGRAMGISELTHDFETEYRWYREFNHANREAHPLKRDTFETFVRNSMGPHAPDELCQYLLLAARVAMDDDYRSALGYSAPSDEERQAVRAIFFTLGSLVERLPPTAFLRSLQNNPAHARYTRPEELGVAGRSSHLPDASAPASELPLLSWEEVRRHASRNSLWVVIDHEVYDLTRWAHQHPGGIDRLLKYAGRDATEAFRAAAHSSHTRVLRLNFRIGRVRPEASETLEAAGRIGVHLERGNRLPVQRMP